MITSSWPFILCCKCDSRLVFVPSFTSVRENGPSCPVPVVSLTAYPVGDECGPTTGRTEVSSLDSQLMVPFLPRSTFSCTLALAVGGSSGNPPHLRDCVGALPSDAAPLPSMSFQTFLRMGDAGLPVSSSATQLLAECSRPGERLSLPSMETSIQSSVFPLRLLGFFQVIPSPAALQLFLEDVGRDT